MKTTNIVTAVTILLYSQHSSAMPSPTFELVPRGKADIIKSLLKLFSGFFPEEEMTWYTVPYISIELKPANIEKGH